MHRLRRLSRILPGSRRIGAISAPTLPSPACGGGLGRGRPERKETDMARQYNLMSADGHLEVPPERWVHRVPEKYRDRAPHTVHLPDGGDALMIEGQPLLEANFLDLRAGRAEGTWQPFGLKVADAAGTGSPEQRVQEQDQDGMDAEVLFAAMVAGPVFWRNIAHDEVYKAVIRGYNDWLAEEYCAVAPDRLIGMGVIPITNVDDAIAEMKHCKKLGLKGVSIGRTAQRQRLPDAGGRQILGRRSRYGDAGHRACAVLPHRSARDSADLQIPEGRPGDHAAAAPAVPRMAVQFRIGAIGQHCAAGACGRVRAPSEAEDLFCRDPPRLGPVLARAHGSVVPAPSRLGAGISRLQAAEGIAEPLCARARLFQRAVRAGRDRGTPACRRRSHHVRDRLPAYRERVAQFPADHRQDLRRYPESDKRKIWAGNAVEFFNLGN